MAGSPHCRKWWLILKELVLVESPTHEKAACDKLCVMLAAKFRQLGGRVKLHRQKKAGDHLQVEFRRRLKVSQS